MSFNKSQYVKIVRQNTNFNIGSKFSDWSKEYQKFLNDFKNQPNSDKLFNDDYQNFLRIKQKTTRPATQTFFNDYQKAYNKYYNRYMTLLASDSVTDDILKITPDYTTVPTDTGSILKEWNSYVTRQFTNQVEIDKNVLPSQFNLPTGYIQKLDAYNSFIQQKQRNPLMNFNMNISDLLLTESNPTPTTIKKDVKDGYIKQNDNVYFKAQTSSDSDLGQYIIEPLKSNISLSRDERNNYIVSYEGKRKVFKPMEKNQAKVFIFSGAFEADAVQEYRKNRLIDFGFKKRIPGRTFVTY